MFAAWFRMQLRKQGLSYAEFGRRVHASKSGVAAVASKRRGPPPERISAWMDALQVAGTERERATLLAYVAGMPDHIGKQLLALDDELRVLRQEMAELRAFVATLTPAAQPPRRASGAPRPAGGRARSRSRGRG